jgi:hypothetical protein
MATRRKVVWNMIEKPTQRQRRRNDRRERQRDTRLAYSIPQLAECVGIGRPMLFEEIRAGRLVASKAGRRTLVTREHAKAWLRGLPTTSARETRDLN